MNTKRLYGFALTLIIMAYFAHSPIDRVLPTKAQTKVPTKLSVIKKDPAAFGIKEGHWIKDGECNLERINGVLMSTSESIITKSTPLILTGWAMNTKRSNLPDSVFIRLLAVNKINFFAATTSGISRPDVRSHLKADNNLLASGFKTKINLDNLPEGGYSLTVLMQYNDVIYTCNNGRKIQLNSN